MTLLKWIYRKYSILFRDIFEKWTSDCAYLLHSFSVIFLRLLPAVFRSEGIFCEIDGSGIDCNQYLKSITSLEECFVPMLFKYTYMKASLGCATIQNVMAEVGPLGNSIVAFEDSVACSYRQFCTNEAFTIYDRRFANICEESQDPNPWPIDVLITDTMKREYSSEFSYKWVAFTLPKPVTPAPIIGTPTPPLPSPPTPPTPTEGRVKCRAQPKKIKFMIDPIACDESNNGLQGLRRNLKSKSKGSSNGELYTCEGQKPGGPMSLRITNKYGTVLFEDDVIAGQPYVLSTVHKNLVVEIDSAMCDQKITFHASCSKAIYTGDTFGSFKILDFYY